MKTIQTSYGTYEVTSLGRFNSEKEEVFSCQNNCPACTKRCEFGANYIENSDYGIARWLFMVSIGSLITQGKASIEGIEDEDYQFKLEVTASWDDIIESVKYQ